MRNIVLVGCAHASIERFLILVWP